MVRKMGTRLQVAVSLVAIAGLVAGCGDEFPAESPAEVPLQGTITTGNFSVEAVTLSTTGTGDRFEADALTATIQRADGTSGDVPANLSADGTTLTIGPAAVTAAAPAAQPTQAGAQADVRVIAAVQASAVGEISGVTLTTRDPGDTLDIEGATAHVERPDGDTVPVDMTINAERTQVTLGAFSLKPTPGRLWYWVLNRLVIEGPVSVTDGPTGTTTQIGSLAFSFAMAGDGTVVAPTTVRACIPTLGVASDRRVVVKGLTHERDYIWASVTDNTGAVTFSKAYMADESGQAVIPDTLGQFTAERISGPKSHIEMCFGNMYKKTPRPVPWPPVYDVLAPGEGDRGRLNMLILNGPLGVRNGVTSTLVQIGHLRFGFEALPDGNVVAPATLALSIPTRGIGRTDTVQATGLQPGDFLQIRVVDNSGRVKRSPVVRASSAGAASLENAYGGWPASALSGTESSLSLFFARTDADGDGKPDWF